MNFNENQNVITEEEREAVKKELRVKLWKTITMFSGFLSVLGGLLYILISDLALGNSAQWLFVGIMASFGCAACIIFSESFKTKKAVFYLLKGLGVLCSGLFILVICLYVKNMDREKVMDAKGLLSGELAALLAVIQWLSIVPAGLGIVAQCANITLNIVKGIEE